MGAAVPGACTHTPATPQGQADLAASPPAAVAGPIPPPSGASSPPAAAVAGSIPPPSGASSPPAAAVAGSIPPVAGAASPTPGVAGPQLSTGAPPPAPGVAGPQPSTATTQAPSAEGATDPLRNAPSPELPRHDAPIRPQPLVKRGTCPALEPISTPTSSPAGPTLTGWRVAGSGACHPEPRDTRLFFSRPAGEPRRMGFAKLTVLHPGDTLLAVPAIDAWREDRDATQAPSGLPAGLDARFPHLRGSLPGGARPLSSLAKLTGGGLEALGELDYYDGRPADAAETLKVVLRGGKPGTYPLVLVQRYRRERPRTGSKEEGMLEYHLTFRVVPAGTPVEAPFGELELKDGTYILGEGDLLALPVSLGFANRGGSEERGPLGVQLAR